MANLKCPTHPDEILRRLYYNDNKTRNYLAWFYCRKCGIPQKLVFETKSPEQVLEEI